MELQFLIFSLFLLGIGSVSSSDVKSNLAFVIDVTESMDVDIKQVTKAVDAIVDTVAKSSSSPIDEYVLVTFNGDTKLVTKTKDKAELKKNLGDINVSGGDSTCPEKSLSGIELVLNESKEGSYLYVFTDASADDYKNYSKVEALSQKKGAQVVFLLTGVCDGNTASIDYQVYQNLAKATNGQVFHLKKDEIGQILKYVEETVSSRKDVILSKTLPARQISAFTVNVDEDIKDFVIAVSGENPNIYVSNPKGAEQPLTDVTRLQKVAIVKVANATPGEYKAQVGSATAVSVVVTATASVHFQHGFSTVAPDDITETVRRPAPEKKSYLSIKLIGGDHVKLENAQILSMDDRVILEEPLKLVNKQKDFYTTELIDTPNGMFKIAVNGYDSKKKTNLTRHGITPVQPQTNIEQPVEKVPVATIDGAPTINAEFYKPLTIKCKVSGYPKVDIIWRADDESNKLEYEKASIVELPYDYVSVLKIPKVEKNVTYSCQATNAAGDGIQNVTVLTEAKHFIEVEAKDTTLEYQKPGNISCDINAYPPANVTWYRGRSLLNPDGNFNISANGSVVSVKSMQPNMTGRYICVVKNDDKKVVKLFKVDISGVGPPKIDKTQYTIQAKVGTSVAIRCNLIEAIPEATLSWTFKNADTEVDLNETRNFVVIYNIQTSDAGTYTCKAVNAIGADYHGIELIPEYAPIISDDTESSVTVINGNPVTLDCPADGIPTPTIVWLHNGRVVANKYRHTFYANGSIGFSAELSDEGYYECRATNSRGTHAHTVELNVIVPVAVESPKKSYIEQVEGLPLTLHCRADGPPLPNITWVYRKTNSSDAIKLTDYDASGDLRYARIHHGQSGEYTCTAANAGGSKNITYVVSVTAGPSILYTMKEYHGVVDDMYLRVPCDATGNPKPEILWTFKGQNISSDTKWYLIGEDGSLIIKKINKWAEGVYSCTATNKYGVASEQFTVVVDPYPVERFLSIMIEEGKSATIPCSVPHRPKTDRVRWFKDGQNISSPELHNVTQEDAGTYTCRVSAVDKPAQSGSTKVEVGFKPNFIYEAQDNNIPFQYGRKANMDCSSIAVPPPLITWLHDGRAIQSTYERYEFTMSNDAQKGRYTCAVYNQYGHVQKDFIVA